MKLPLGVLVIVLGCACSSKKKAEPPPSLKACAKPPGLRCNILTCGGNSALINAFPVHGMRPDGECSEEGIQLVPGSLDNTACKGATLDMDGPALVGRRADNSIQCQGNDLKGASFEVRSWKGSERIEITEVTQYADKNGDVRPAYRMEWTKQPDKEANGKRKGLCAKEGQKLRKALKLSTMKFTDDLPDAKANLVIPVRSELYTEQGEAVPVRPGWKAQVPEWVHLACVDDALAKRTIFGHHTSDVAKSRAALRMWTADYCGAVPFTMRGKTFAWGNDPNLEIEAQWTENGASCLTAPRMLRDDAGNPIVPTVMTKRLKDLCKNNCTTIDGWMDVAKTCYMEDGTTVERVIPPCQPCSGAACPLESRIPKGP